MNCTDIFFRAVETNPQKVAFQLEDRSYSFAEVARAVERTRAYYASIGLKKSDRVLVFLRPGLELYCHLLAMFRSGIVAVFVDIWAGSKRIDLCARLADCNAILASSFVRIAGSILPAVRRIRLRIDPAAIRKNHLPEFKPETLEIETRGQATALITFTTGSTGIPKAADRTHAFLGAQFEALTPLMSGLPEGNDLTLLPIVLLLNLGLGQSSTILSSASLKFSKNPTDENARKFLKALEKTNTHSITSSPAFLIELAGYLVRTKTSVRVDRIVTGGAPVYPKEAELLRAAFPKAQLTIVYGSTEAEPISEITPEELIETHRTRAVASGLCVGSVDPSAQVVLLPLGKDRWEFESKEQFERSCLPDGHAGELVVSGKHVLTDYWNNPEAKRDHKFLVDGKLWHRTGDAARVEGNRIFLLGRAKQVIEFQGKTYFPFAVEGALVEEFAVRTAALAFQGNPYLVVERKDRKRWAEIRDYLEKNRLPFQAVVIQAIARDPRHKSKVDYDRTLKILQKTLSKKIIRHLG